MEEFDNKPCINVVVKNLDNNLVRNILAGIEEEGLPYEVFNLGSRDILSTTHKASRLSKLGVGVGFSEGRTIVHYHKLGESYPILDTSLKSYEIDKARKIGNNAARLYKVMPLKDINSSEINSLIEIIKSKVTEILNKGD